MESVGFQKLRAPCFHCKCLCLPSLFTCSEGEDYFFPQSIVYICLAAVGAINHIEVHDS